MAGLSTTKSISFGTAFVAGKNLVPSPAAGITAFIDSLLLGFGGASHQPTNVAIKLQAFYRRFRRFAKTPDQLTLRCTVAHHLCVPKNSYVAKYATNFFHANLKHHSTPANAYYGCNQTFFNPF
jgi:hypothetical protein